MLRRKLVVNTTIGLVLLNMGSYITLFAHYQRPYYAYTPCLLL